MDMRTLEGMATSLGDAKAAYLDNADYETTADTAKCGAFVVACWRLLVLLPERSAQRGTGGDGDAVLGVTWRLSVRIFHGFGATRNVATFVRARIFRGLATAATKRLRLPRFPFFQSRDA